MNCGLVCIQILTTSIVPCDKFSLMHYLISIFYNPLQNNSLSTTTLLTTLIKALIPFTTPILRHGTPNSLNSKGVYNVHAIGF